ncbi:MAG: retroviral-like aspartic protease family protein [Gemmatimonadaceae bacterium]
MRRKHGDRLETTVGIESPLERGRVVEIRDVLVDTGAEATWIPSDVLESLGIRRERTEQYGMADGRVLARSVGFAIVHAGGKATNDDVVFAEPTDLTLLGARSMEGLNLRIEPRTRQLVSAGPIVAAFVA